MATYLGVETIVARYMTDLVKVLESKECDYCGVGSWHVLNIGLNVRADIAIVYEVFCRLQCNECSGKNMLSWSLEPYAKKGK